MRMDRVHKALKEYILNTDKFVEEKGHKLTPVFSPKLQDTYGLIKIAEQKEEGFYVQFESVQKYLFELNRDVLLKLKGLVAMHKEFMRDRSNFYSVPGVGNYCLSQKGLEGAKRLNGAAKKILQEIGAEEDALKKVWKSFKKI